LAREAHANNNNNLANNGKVAISENDDGRERVTEEEERVSI